MAREAHPAEHWTCPHRVDVIRWSSDTTHAWVETDEALGSYWWEVSAIQLDAPPLLTFWFSDPNTAFTFKIRFA